MTHSFKTAQIVDTLESHITGVHTTRTQTRTHAHGRTQRRQLLISFKITYLNCKIDNIDVNGQEDDANYHADNAYRLVLRRQFSFICVADGRLFVLRVKAVATSTVEHNDSVFRYLPIIENRRGRFRGAERACLAGQLTGTRELSDSDTSGNLLPVLIWRANTLSRVKESLAR